MDGWKHRAKMLISGAQNYMIDGRALK